MFNKLVEFIFRVLRLKSGKAEDFLEKFYNDQEDDNAGE